MLRSASGSSRVAPLPSVQSGPSYATVANVGMAERSGGFGSTDGGESAPPTRLPKTVASRLWLDSGMAPHIVDLRMNHRNLIHEMSMHNGQIVSGHCTRLRAQRKLMEPKAPAPPAQQTLHLPGLKGSKKILRLQAQLLRDMADAGNTSGYQRQEVRRKAETKGARFAQFWVEDEPNRSTTKAGAEAKSSKESSRGSPTSSPRSPTRREKSDLKRATSEKLLRAASMKVEDTAAAAGDDHEDAEVESSAPSEASRSSLSQEELPESVEELLLKAVQVPEEEAKRVYGYFQGGAKDSLLPSGCLGRALEALGYSFLEADLKELGTTADPKEPLSLEGFLEVVTALAQRRQKEMLDQFKGLDADGSGTISHREFRRLMWDLSYTVTSDAAREFLDEVTTSGEKTGQVHLEEFIEAVRLVHLRQGFMREEVAKFSEIFDKYDVELSGKLTADSLASALGWLGSSTSITQARAIIHRFGDDGAAYLVKPEFLRIMRLRFEEEHSRIRSLFAEYDTDASGTMEAQEVAELCQRLGYLLSGEVTSECLQALRISGDEIVYEDVIALVQLMHQREGFTLKELQELAQVFDANTTGSGHMREFEMINALTWLGITMPPARRHELWCKVDIDKSDMIEKNEFLKMMRILRDQDIQSAQNLLALCEIKHSGRLGEEDVKDMLIRMGHAPETSFLRSAMQQCTDSMGKATVQGVMDLLNLVRQHNYKSVRVRAGLPDNRSARVMGRLDTKLQAGKSIKVDELEKLLNELYPREKNLVIGITVAELIQQECQADMVQTLPQAFQVARRYGDMLEEAVWKKHQELIRKAHYSTQEVAQLRAAFRQADTDFSGSLSEAELLETFRSVMPDMTPRQQQVLVAEAADLRDTMSTIDFFQFLRLTSKVRDVEGRKSKVLPAAEKEQP